MQRVVTAVSAAFAAVAVSAGARLCAQDGPPLSQRVAAYLTPLHELGLWSGAVLIAKAGEVLVARADGLADRAAGTLNTVDTRFKLMSTSKTFTGVAVLQLVERGLLRLEDPIAAHVPDWPEAWATVTVHDLLDHTSGIPDQEGPWAAASRRLVGRGEPWSLANVWLACRPQPAPPLFAAPGSTFRYSNANTTFAGLVAELVADRPYADLVRERILGPAGLAATGFDDGGRHDGLAIGHSLGDDGGPVESAQDMRHIQPAGGYWSTVGDLYRFDRALRDDTLLGAGTRRRLVTPKHGDYACCFFNRPMHGHACVQHSGGANGYVADFLRFVDDDACVVVLSNFAFAPVLRISSDLAALLFGVGVEVPVVPDGEALAACEGVYEHGGGSLVVRRSGRTLITFEVLPQQERVGGRLLLPIGASRFKESLGDGTLQLERVGDERRIRRTLPGGEALLGRVAVPSASWDTLVGTWLADVGGETGAEVTITRDRGALRLRAERLWPSAAEILPIAADRALLLYGAGGGIVLRREGDRLGFRRYDGAPTTMRRK